jgi:hypothetical protein
VSRAAPVCGIVKKSDTGNNEMYQKGAHYLAIGGAVQLK